MLTVTTGASVFGIRSRPSSRYENAPSTSSAAVIMMAKTGRLTLTSESIIGRLPCVCPAAGRVLARVRRAASAAAAAVRRRS